MGIVTILIIIYILIKLNRWRLEKKWGSVDIPNEVSARGKIVLITGANAGIGKSTSKEFAMRDATVILACRDPSRAEEAVKWIRSQTSMGELDFMKLDLNSLQSVRQFCKEFQAKYDRLDVLINNAGVVMPVEERKRTADGFEIHMGVNHLGHFLLTNLLLDQLEKGAPSRIVNVTSEMHAWAPLDLDDIMSDQDKNFIVKAKVPWGNPLYCKSKLANVLFNMELAKRLEGTSVTTYACTPGVVASDLSQNLRGVAGKINQTLRHLGKYAFLKTLDQGAATTIHCALNKGLANESGKLYMNCGDCGPDYKAIVTESEAKKLWEISAKLVGL